MNPSILSKFDALLRAARACEAVSEDIALAIPEAFEKDLPIANLAELLGGLAAIGSLRFSALLAAYEEAMGDMGHFSDDMEESIMGWWGVCDDLRSAFEGVEMGVLDKDGIANALLGAQALARVRGVKFFKIADIAMQGRQA